MLGYEDHGIMTIYLTLDYGGTMQGFGGYALDVYSEEDKERLPSKALGEWVMNLLDIVGVNKYEDLKGKYIRVELEEGWNGKILGIGNLLEDKWFRP